MLAKTVDKNQRNWLEIPPCILLAYRTSVHESISYIPHFLVCGHEPAVPTNLNFSHQVKLVGLTITSTLLTHGSGSTQPTNRLVITCNVSRKVNMSFIRLKCMSPQTPKARWNSSTVPHLPKDSVMKLNFVRGPYKITQVVSEKSFTISEIEPNKRLFVHYD